MYDKINFVYTAYPHLGAAYFGTYGLVAALKRIGKLHYAFNTRGSEFLDKQELQKYPIFYMNGHTLGPLIEAGGNQFKANFHSESMYTRHGTLDMSGKLLRERENMFDLMFVCADSDLNSYTTKTIFMSPWADTNVMYPIQREVKNELFFMGGKSGREDFLNEDKDNRIVRQQTEFDVDPIVNVNRYTQLMSNYLHIVNPPGRAYNGVTGRLWEILACKRLCYQYSNPDTMFKTLEEFEDGKHIVYFKDMAELYEKHDYYLNHIDEAWAIAEEGHCRFLQRHTELHRANFLVNHILSEVESVLTHDNC